MFSCGISFNPISAISSLCQGFNNLCSRQGNNHAPAGNAAATNLQGTEGRNVQTNKYTAAFVDNAHPGYATKVNEIKDRLFGDSLCSKSELKKAFREHPGSKARLEQLNPKAYGNQIEGAKECLRAMKPEVRHAFLEILAMESKMNQPGALLESGLNLEQWNDDAIKPAHIFDITNPDDAQTNTELLPLPRYKAIRGGESLEAGESQQKIDRFKTSIIETGLDMKKWGAEDPGYQGSGGTWTGSPGEGRHRSLAGYQMASAIGLHPSLLRFPGVASQESLI